MIFEKARWIAFSELERQAAEAVEELMSIYGFFVPAPQADQAGLPRRFLEVVLPSPSAR